MGMRKEGKIVCLFFVQHNENKKEGLFFIHRLIFAQLKSVGHYTIRKDQLKGGGRLAVERCVVCLTNYIAAMHSNLAIFYPILHHNLLEDYKAQSEIMVGESSWNVVFTIKGSQRRFFE